MCAERNAICKAISEGHRQFVAAAVVAFQEDVFTSPCGVCRQFMSEFAAKDYPVYISKPERSRVMVTTIYTLLPHRFIPQFLLGKE